MKKILSFFALLMLSVLTMGVVCAKQNIDPNADNYTEVHALHILTKTKNQSKAVIMRVNNGESFKALAKQFSNCPSGRVGGDLGWFKRGQMVPELKKPHLKLRSAKCQTPFKPISAGTL